MEGINIDFLKVLFSVMLIWVFILLLKSYNALVLKPWNLRSALKKQGIDGPPPTFLLGNLLEIKRALSHAANGSTNDRLPLLHNVQAVLFPFFDKWRQKYGETLMYSIGNTYILHVTTPDMVNDIINCITPNFGKPPYHMEFVKPLLGNGVVTSSGLAWSSQRKILAPEFHLEKLKIVKERKKAGIEDDLLQTILEAAKTRGLSEESMNKFIVDNCKSIYLAGYETTAVSAQWCLMLLSLYPEWQNRVRAELTMVINETMRLYPPVAMMPREAFTDLRFGNVTIPKDFNIWLIMTALHTDPKVWGSDAYEFKPNRFENGVAGACKYPYMYISTCHLELE